MSLSFEQQLRAAASALGLGASDLLVLEHLLVSGRLTPREIAARLAISTGSTTAVLDRIESMNLVCRVPNRHDRRSLLIELTPDGRVLVGWVADRFAAQLGEAMRVGAVGEPAPLLGLLSELAVVMGRRSAPGWPPDVPRSHLVNGHRAGR
jgi:DNA-binding MarR family transcriptional regulator